MLFAAILTLLRFRHWPVVALGMGAILTAWLAIETALIGWRGDKQAVLLIVCGLPALVMITAGWSAGGVATVRAWLPR